MQQAVEQRDIAAQAKLQVDIRQVCQASAARIDDDQRGAARLGAQHARADHGVVLGDVGADHQQQVGLVDVGDAATHRPGAQGASQAGHRRAVADARAMVDVVGAQHRAGKFLRRVIVLIAGMGAADHPDAGRPQFVQRQLEAFGGSRQRLLPTGRAQAAVFPNQWLAQAPGGLDGEAARPALGAQLTFADRMSGLRLDANDPALLHAQPQTAADATEGADARHHVHVQPPGAMARMLQGTW